MSNDTQPEIRFPGFTEDWELRKLGEILVLLKDGTHGTHKDVDEGMYLLSAKNIKNGKINIDESDRIISEDEYKSIHKNFNLEKGDVLLTIVGSIGEAAVLENPFKLTFQRSVAYLRPNGTLTSQFLYTTIMSTKFQRELKKRQVVSAQPGIYLGDLSMIPIELPCMEEQQKIGTFFKQLDDTITLHQRKLDLLKETKKGFLQKMFPKNGAKVPEIRFPGFTGDWEQRKVFEISKVTYGGGTPKTNTKEFWNGNIPWIQSSDLEINRLFNVSPKKKITSEAVKKSAAKIIPPNSIAIVTRVGVGKLALMPFEYATSQDFLSLSELQIDSYFGIFSLYSMLQKELKNIQGTSIKGMTKSDLLEKKVTIPKKYEEQQKIGAFFKQLDDTIALHQHELDLLKETKKGFLQKMFV
ncbi:restriction endonuclease subunit S [Enterococcus faecium]|uniref:restriction endonuclease subunit S n=1 Tax=Enterococcus faecium TaxID=1352 RepID=UPI00313DFA3E